MRKMVKRLLKKYKYPPEDYETAISTVISQCEMWTDNMDTVPAPKPVVYSFEPPKLQMVAEERAVYGSVTKEQ
jgi:type I restriction enzyme R subunit